MGSIPNWRAEGSTHAGPTVAPLPLGTSVDTGTHERVANWSPDSVAAVDPCDPGTDPRNGPFAGVPHGRYLFNSQSREIPNVLLAIVRQHVHARMPVLPVSTEHTSTKDSRPVSSET